MTKALVQQQWEDELKNPEDENIDYRAEKDISKQDKMIGNLVLSLQNIPGLDQNGTKYTSEDKITAVTAYFVTGSIKEASQIAGVPAWTIRKWKQETPWWNQAVMEVKRAKQEQLDAKLTNLIEKTMSELRDRLMHGDEVVTGKGKKIRKKVSARDLSVITGVLYDKRTHIRRDVDPTQDKPEDEDTLNKLKNDFEKLSREINAKVIDGEHSTSSVVNKQQLKEIVIDGEETKTDEK